MIKKLKKLNKNDKEKKILKHRRPVVKNYKDGWYLGELCRNFKLDISSILFLLKKSKLKKKKLYAIFQNQIDRVNKTDEIVLEKEKKILEKFFPASASSNFSGGYYWLWKEKYKQEQKEKENCNHTIRHIRCSTCNKILKDASNISLDDIITYKLDEKERMDI